MPPREPRSPALGTTRRTQSPKKAKTVLTTPMTIMTAIPTYQVV